MLNANHWNYIVYFKVYSTLIIIWFKICHKSCKLDNYIRLKEINNVLGCRCPCCFRIWNLCGNLRSVTHDFELGGAVLADWTVVGGGSRHQLNLVALIDIVLGEAPPTDEEACLSTQTALCWSDGVHLGLWNPTHKINSILTGYKRVTKRPILLLR